MENGTLTIKGERTLENKEIAIAHAAYRAMLECFLTFTPAVRGTQRGAPYRCSSCRRCRVCTEDPCTSSSRSKRFFPSTGGTGR